MFLCYQMEKYYYEAEWHILLSINYWLMDTVVLLCKHNFHGVAVWGEVTIYYILLRSVIYNNASYSIN